MKTLCKAALVCGAALSSLQAQILLQESWTTFDGGAPSLVIPDNNATGVSDIRSVASMFLPIIEVRVWVKTEGNFDGDLYFTLQHNGSQAVLLNRPGRSGSEPFGYDGGSMDITFHDGAANGDIHTYRNVTTPISGATLTGSWQPDGRDVDPALSVSGTPRTAMLGVFSGQDVNGEWTLFAADVSGGGDTRILSWGMDITVVPEPDDYQRAAAFALGIGYLFHRARRRS